MMKRSLFAFAALCLMANAYADTLPPRNHWKTECIGRYLVDLPGEVSVVLPYPKAFIPHKDIALGDYVDRTEALRFSSSPNSMYVLGNNESIGVTPEVTQAEFDELRRTFREEKQFYLDLVARDEKAGFKGSAKEFREQAEKVRPQPDFDTTTLFGWADNESAFLFTYQAGRIFSFSPFFTPATTVGQPDPASKVAAFLNHFHPRSLYETPKETGVCFPYGFFSDDGIPKSAINVNMQLKEHPDILISLLVGGIEAVPPKDAINNYYDTFENHVRRYVTRDEDYRPIRMDKRNGGGLSFSIIRNYDTKEYLSQEEQRKTNLTYKIVPHPDTEDYAFIAYVTGDKTATPSLPSMMLYIGREATATEGKPLTKDEIESIAKEIMASVRRRE